MRDVRREAEVVAYAEHMVDEGLWAVEDLVMDKRSGRIHLVRDLVLDRAYDRGGSPAYE